MENYRVVHGNPVFSAVSYGPFAGANSGKFVSATSGFKADLLYSLDGGGTYFLAAGSQTAFFPGSQDSGSPTTDGAGVFIGPQVTIPGYASGPVNFIVEVYNGSSFASSMVSGGYAGQSVPFLINSLNTNLLAFSDDILQLNGGTTPTGLQPFIPVIPEPSIFSLAALGGAGFVVYCRRKGEFIGSHQTRV